MRYRFAALGRLAVAFKEYIETTHHSEITCEAYENEDQLKPVIHKYNAIAAFTIGQELDLSFIQWIHSFGAGVDGILHNTTLPSDLLLTRTSGKMGVKMGEYCLTYILSDLRNVVALLKQQEDKIWQPHTYTDLYKQSILIFGTGSIGQPVANTLKPLCQTVDGVNLSGTAISGFDRIMKIDQLTDLDNYNVIINTLPLTPLTKGFYNDGFFKQCRSALFINVGRGQSVDSKALLKALDNGRIRKAVLDVFETEPLPPIDALWKHPNVIITPHNASKTTIGDVILSFESIYQDIIHKRKPKLAADIRRGY